MAHTRFETERREEIRRRVRLEREAVNLRAHFVQPESQPATFKARVTGHEHAFTAPKFCFNHAVSMTWLSGGVKGAPFPESGCMVQPMMYFIPLMNKEILGDLRGQILGLCREYFANTPHANPTFTAGETYIPVTGKTLDERDLELLVESSLDLWLT
ncbi:MAG: hypothetical protein H7841_17620, partial [Magnetospirillum sp. WYHS-4]